MRRSPFPPTAALIALAVVAGVLASAVTAPATARPAGDRALVRLAHFAENVPAADITVIAADGRRTSADVRYRTVSGYVPFEPGTYRVEARLDGATLAASPVELDGGAVYSLALVGRSARDNELLVIRDAATATGAEGGRGAGGQTAGWRVALACALAAVAVVVWRRRRAATRQAGG